MVSKSIKNVAKSAMKNRISLGKKPTQVKKPSDVFQVYATDDYKKINLGKANSLLKAKKLAIKESELFSDKIELWEDKEMKGSLKKYYKGKMWEGCNIIIETPKGKEFGLVGEELEAW